MPMKINNNPVIILKKSGTLEEIKYLRTTDGYTGHKRVTITFDANGGTGGSTQVRTWGVEQTTTPTTPTRSGYSFKGWYTTATGGTKVTFPMETPVYDITYHAQWEVHQTGSLKWVYKGPSSTKICFCQGINMVGSPCSTYGETITICGADAGQSDQCSVLECIWQ